MFCKIATKQIPSEVVYEDDVCIAFLDINPRNIGHTLLIPKNHFTDIFDVSDDVLSKLIVTLKNVAVRIKDAINADGISISQSNGTAAGQVVHHIHFHIIPRFKNEPPPGLEGLLPIKRLAPEMLKEIANKIRSQQSIDRIEDF